MLEKVVIKLSMDPYKMVICTPEWRDQAWWKPLEKMTVGRVYLAWDEGLYHRNRYVDSLPHPRWRTVVSYVDTGKWRVDIPPNDVAHWVAKKNRGWGLEHLKKELKQEKRVAVTTRSGRVVEEDMDGEESMEEQDKPQTIPVGKKMHSVRTPQPQQEGGSQNLNLPQT